MSEDQLEDDDNWTPTDPLEDRHHAFYYWIGRCITDFASIEEILFDICSIVLNTRSTQIASIVFYRTPSIDSRTTLVDELLSAMYPTMSGKHSNEIIKSWDAVRKEIVELVPYRNAMAHQSTALKREGQIDIIEGKNGEMELDFSARREYFTVEVSKSEALRGRKLKVEKVTEHELGGIWWRTSMVAIDLIKLGLFYNKRRSQNIKNKKTQSAVRQQANADAIISAQHFDSRLDHLGRDFDLVFCLVRRPVGCHS